MNEKKIIDYYDYTLPFYKFFYHGKTNGIHYGYWDKETKNHDEALLNTNKFLAEIAGLTQNDYVLDAGCGVGGSAIWIAKKYKAHVAGITLSNKQILEAKKLTAKNNASSLVSFYKKDFLNTGFKNDLFSVVWAIESSCYAKNKKDFLREAYRVLKKGGRLIVWDGFLYQQPKNEKEKKDLNAFLEGWVLPNIAEVSEFKKNLTEVGFKNIKEIDVSKEIYPSAKKIYKMSRWSYPLSIILNKIGLIPSLMLKNNLSGIIQRRIIKNDIMKLMVYYAEK